tara:strand:- start:200 stop:490 length:291 start_codon:yes stop_codon:yes gene_type:complete
MSNDSDVYLRVVLKSIDTINDSLPVALRLPGKPESVLIGDDGIYDSLSLINLLVEIEMLLQTLGHEVLLLDEDLITNSNGPFATVQSLADYICKRI